MGFLVQFDAPALATSSDQVTRSFGITFDGEDVFVASETGTATEAAIEGGPRGFRGLPGLDNYELWLREGNFGSYEDFTATYIGADGAPGPSGYIAYDSDTASYPVRPIPGLPVTFVGPVSPLDLGVMIDGDVWNNTTADPFADAVLVALGEVDGLVADHLADENSLTFAQTKAIADASAALVGGLLTEVRYRVQPNQTSLDEFTGTVFDSGWVRADPTAPERVTWRKGGGAAGFTHSGGDAASVMHALLHPATPLAVGEAWETCSRMFVAFEASSTMMGLMVSTSGTNTQFMLAANYWTTNSVSGAYNLGLRQHTNLNTAGGADAANVSPWAGGRVISQATMYTRLVRAAANSWEAHWSQDGINWTLTNRFTPARLNDAYTHVGFFVSTWASPMPFSGSFDYLRKVTL